MRNRLLLLIFTTVAGIAVISSCSEEEIKYKRYYADGLQLYKNHCQSCHMADGTGLPGVIPPLTDSVFLNKNRKQLACIVKFGLNDTIIVNEKVYDTPMPAENHLAPIDIAKVLTYITNTFGNQQGIYDVTEVENNLNNNCKNKVVNLYSKLLYRCPDKSGRRKVRATQGILLPNRKASM